MEKNLTILIEYLSYKRTEVSPNGYILVGANSLGKTFSMEKTLKLLFEECPNNLIYLPEYIQDINTDVEVDRIGRGFSPTSSSSDILRSVRDITEERIETKQNEDEELKSVSNFLLKCLIVKPDDEHIYLYEFFEKKFGFTLYWDNGIKIHFTSKYKGDFLTSSGYKAIIRITTEIYMSIRQIIQKSPTGRILIFIDEIDAKLYWGNRELFFSELYDFITNTFRDISINFILSTHMPETVARAPEGFSIIKFLPGEEISFKEYHSEDFLTIDQVEKVIFDKNKSIIKESETLKRLKEIYFTCLKCTPSFRRNCRNCSYELWNYDIKTTKERIIYDAIEDLQRR